MSYFVWTRGAKGPQAQIWHEDQVDGAGKPRKDYIFKKKLDAGDTGLSLDQLAIKYADKANERSLD